MLRANIDLSFSKAPIVLLFQYEITIYFAAAFPR